MTQREIAKMLKRESKIWDILEDNLSEKNIKLIQELIYIGEELTAEDGR